MHRFIDDAKKKNKGIHEIADFQTHIVANLVDYNPLNAINSPANRLFGAEQSNRNNLKASGVIES